VVAQNGLGRADAVRPLVPGVDVIPALLYIGAERVAAGRVSHFAGRRVTVPAGPQGRRVAESFSGSGLEIHPTSDFATAAWRKLLGNVMANPITALTLRRIDVLRDPAIEELARGLVREAVAVGQADGAALNDDDVERIVSAARNFGGAGSSMLYDRLAGRAMEWDTITGEVVRRARRYGVDVPLNTAILALLRAIDEGGTDER
jgi:2-dehydropantoate 2-reductase